MKEIKNTIDYNEKVLEVKNLTTVFKVGTGKDRFDLYAVNDVSFDIHKREVFGLVGESGCGKTTTSRTVIRLYRPTNGEVTFEGVKIGSGPQQYFNNLKAAKEQYKIDKIKLNERKHKIYEINLEFDQRVDELKYQIELQEHNKKIEKEQIQESISEYKDKRYAEKNRYAQELDAVKFGYIQASEESKALVTNYAEQQYKEILKSYKNNHYIKMDSVKHSAGLSAEEKKKQSEFLVAQYNENLSNLKEEFDVKIKEAEKELISKEEYKLRKNTAKKRYITEKEEVVNKHKTNQTEIVKPDLASIRVEIQELNLKYKEIINEIKNQIAEVQSERKEAISKVEELNVVDTEKVKELKLKYQEYVKEQKGLIKKSKEIHYNREAKNQIRKMQMIFQDPISSLNPRMTVGEIVSEGLVINGEKDKKYINKKVVEVLETVGLSADYTTRYPHEFSGGQRQRIGIARALIMEPSFIIADEPISALDVSIRAQILNLLTDLKSKLDLTILFIAHDLSVVRYFTDRTAVMFNGRIVEMAPTKDLFESPLHPYTKSLLSAIPEPDPDIEKDRKRINYNPMVHDYRVDRPKLREITKGHFIYCNEKEYKEYLKEIGEKNA